jgi:hypothetical protein
MSDLEKSTGFRRSRRNLIKISAIAASAMLATMKTKPVHAQPGQNPGQKGQNNVTCFLRGTTIRTADGGGKRIEDLAVGDLLPAVFGGVRPIQWISRYRFRKSDPTKGWVKDVLLGSLDELLVPMCRTPICLSRRHMHCS